MPEQIRWVANLSLLFTEHELLDRPGAARRAGFREVEFWWPFGTTGRPARSAVEAFVTAVESAGVSLTAMNLFAGDMPAGERGVLSYPERTEEFRDSVAVAMEVGDRLGTRLFNAPYGHRRAGLDHGAQDAVADESLTFAARAASRIGGVVMLEPVSGMPDYPMKTSDDAIRIIDRIHTATGVTNLGLLLDQFHVAMNGGDAVADSRSHASRIIHVQLADTPGRGEPGTGDADFAGVINTLHERGYAGAFALEYIPTTDTERSLETWRTALATWPTSVRGIRTGEGS